MFACCRSNEAVENGAFPAATKDIKENGVVDHTQSDSSNSHLEEGGDAGNLGIAHRRNCQWEEPQRNDVDSAISTVVTDNTSPLKGEISSIALPAIDESSVTLEDELAALVGESPEQEPFEDTREESDDEDIKMLHKMRLLLHDKLEKQQEEKRRKQQESTGTPTKMLVQQEITVTPEELRKSQPKVEERKVLEFEKDDEEDNKSEEVPKTPDRYTDKTSKESEVKASPIDQNLEAETSPLGMQRTSSRRKVLSEPRPVLSLTPPHSQDLVAENDKPDLLKLTPPRSTREEQQTQTFSPPNPTRKEHEDFLAKLKKKKRSLEASIRKSLPPEENTVHDDDETKVGTEENKEDAPSTPESTKKSLKTPEKRSVGIHVTAATLVLPSPAATTHSASGPPPLTTQKPLELTQGYKDCSHLPAHDVQAYEKWYTRGLLHWRPASNESELAQATGRPSAASPGDLSPPSSPRRTDARPKPASPGDLCSPPSPKHPVDTSPRMPRRSASRTETSENSDELRLQRWSERASRSRKAPIVSLFGTPMERKGPPKHIVAAVSNTSPVSLFGSPVPVTKMTQQMSPLEDDGSPATFTSSSTDESSRTSGSSPVSTGVQQQVSPESSVTSSVASRVKFYQNYVSAYKSYLGDRSPRSKSNQHRALQQLEASKESSSSPPSSES